ncbi:hypothetical protein KKA85_12155 [bacterium]|nr:hypothetical protein [bacterium]MBU1676520.1 hypothetical protein [bacterium]
MRQMTCVFLILALLAGVAAAGDVTTVEGVTHVRNGAQPSDGVHDLKLEELWRRGGADDDIIFGVIVQALVDGDGNVYLLDSQLSEVQVFAADGEFVKTLSREGDGPGEVRQPFDMLWMPDGSLGLVQSFPGKIIQVTLDDTPAGVFQQQGEEGAIIAVVEAEGGGGNLVMGGVDVEITQGGQIRHMFIAGYDVAGNETARYVAYDVNWDFRNFVLREREQYLVLFGRWDVAADGSVITAADPDAYEFRIYAADGTLRSVVTREHEPLKRDEEGYQVMRNMLEGMKRQFPFPVETEYADYESPVNTLFVHPDGNIWVQPMRGVRGQPDGVLAVYDVFSPDGHFLRQERVSCPGNGMKDGIIFAGRERLLVVHGLLDSMAGLFGGSGEETDEEAAPVEVVCYRIVE